MRLGRHLGGLCSVWSVWPVVPIGCIAMTLTCAQAHRTTPRAGDWEALAPGCVNREALSERAVVVVVLDGARWQEIFVGVDPALAAADGLEVVTPPMPRLHAVMAG